MISLLKEVEQFFKQTPTIEARALIYKNVNGNDYKLVYPKAHNTAVTTTSNLELNTFIGGQVYYLYADLHSHHSMGAFFSLTDNQAELTISKIAPCTIFGVFS